MVAAAAVAMVAATVDAAVATEAAVEVSKDFPFLAALGPLC